MDKEHCVDCTYRYTPSARWPIAWHHTVIARHHTLLVYEGNQSHVIKNMAACWGFRGFRDCNCMVSRCATTYFLIMWPVIFFYVLYCMVSRYRTACSLKGNFNCENCLESFKSIGIPVLPHRIIVLTCQDSFIFLSRKLDGFHAKKNIMKVSPRNPFYSEEQ